MIAGAQGERAHRAVCYAFAASLALFEGPAQISCVLVLLAAIATGRARSWRPGWFELGVVLWWLAGVPGLFVLNVRPSSGELTRPLMALAALVGAWSLNTDDEPLLGRLAWIFGGCLALNGAYGLLQLGFGPFPWDSLFLKNPQSGQIWIPNRVYHELAASGLYYNRLKLAHVGLTGLALFGLVLVQKGVSERTRRAAGLGLLVLGGGVLYTYARMALVGLAGGGLTLAALSARAKTVLKVAAAGVALVGLVLLTEYGRSRFLTISEDGQLRLGLFRAGWRLFLEHPLFGVGHGAYGLTVGPYLPAGASGVHLTSPHNQWLQVLAETGLVGFLGFVLATTTAWWRALQVVLHSGPGPALLHRFVLVSMVGLLITGLTHSTLHHPTVALLYWSLAGIAVSARRR
ncbi:MAG: O-antigen ligase family protein [Deltaproteobacteria bacterium]|nr:O-antigen ligase family protein [Deltaproteobacteria bacterium]